MDMGQKSEKTVALAGNPNVGKSTVFNALTGLHQHTGNWPGKTITNASGTYLYQGEIYKLVDLPGTYSLLASSPEEEIARDFICFEHADAVVLVADATCLERNLNLILQILEITDNAVLCVNLLDEAKKKGICIDLHRLSSLLGIPVIGAAARSGTGLSALKEQIARSCHKSQEDLSSSAPQSSDQNEPRPRRRGAVTIEYAPAVEEAIKAVEPAASLLPHLDMDLRWLCLRLLDPDETLCAALEKQMKMPLENCRELTRSLTQAKWLLKQAGLESADLRDSIACSVVTRAASLYSSCVTLENIHYHERDRKLDKILTSKATGIPVMIGLLCFIFWLTITGANYPSQLLSALFSKGEFALNTILEAVGAPWWIQGALADGVYKTLSWVVSVMLPPMAIFFPLFTLLEDSGYLPRIAFNMDHFFKKACAHGKQSLTTCMGFGCNACGVIGCRIIDSPRERLIAILTNNFVPCNGRFPPPYKGKQNSSQVLTGKNGPNSSCPM